MRGVGLAFLELGLQSTPLCQAEGLPQRERSFWRPAGFKGLGSDQGLPTGTSPCAPPAAQPDVHSPRPDPPFSPGYAYFLRGRLYWKFDPVKVKVLEGFPRRVGPDFFGCAEPANTFH